MSCESIGLNNPPDASLFFPRSRSADFPVGGDISALILDPVFPKQQLSRCKESRSIF
uniref:Uncharacterized protein n=1 Tax=Rhizophora mucronata TaxID=61149 RepID=A0A2P2IJD0_RHIMU